MMIQPKPLPQFPEEGLLTKQQRNVLKYLVHGYLHKQIAHELNISSRTVADHKFNIYQALNVRGPVQLMRLVYQLDKTDALIAPYEIQASNF